MQPLIEALSELVSQIAQIIVVNKAVNKAPPKELPMCVSAVQQSAAKLVEVAKQLAQVSSKRRSNSCPVSDESLGRV